MRALICIATILVGSSAYAQLQPCGHGKRCSSVDFTATTPTGTNAVNIKSGARLNLNYGTNTALISFDGTEFDVTKPFHVLMASGTPYFALEQSDGGASTFYFISGGGAYLGFSGAALTFGTAASSGGPVTPVGSISSAGVFGGTGFSGSTTATFNLLESSTTATAATASVPAWRLRPSTAYDANDLIFQVTKSDNTSLFTVDVEGDTVSTGVSAASGFTGATTSTLNALISNTSAANATSSVPAWRALPSGALDADDLVFEAAKSDGTSLLKVDVEGDTTVAGTHTAAGYVGSTTSTLNALVSSTSAANATSSVPAWRVRPSGALDANDLVFEAAKSDGTSLLKVDVEGDTTVAGSLTVTGSITGSGANQIIELGSDQTTNSGTIGDLTGLSWSVAANTTYGFTCRIVHQNDTVGGGFWFALNGPASPTLLEYTYQSQSATGTATNGAQVGGHGQGVHVRDTYDGSQSTTTHVSGANLNHWTELKGIFRNGANAGTMQVRFATDGTGILTVKAYSRCVIN